MKAKAPTPTHDGKFRSVVSRHPPETRQQSIVLQIVPTVKARYFNQHTTCFSYIEGNDLQTLDNGILTSAQSALAILKTIDLQT